MLESAIILLLLRARDVLDEGLRHHQRRERVDLEDVPPRSSDRSVPEILPVEPRSPPTPALQISTSIASPLSFLRERLHRRVVGDLERVVMDVALDALRVPRACARRPAPSSPWRHTAW